MDTYFSYLELRHYERESIGRFRFEPSLGSWIQPLGVGQTTFVMRIEVDRSHYLLGCHIQNFRGTKKKL